MKASATSVHSRRCLCINTRRRGSIFEISAINSRTTLRTPSSARRCIDSSAWSSPRNFRITAKTCGASRRQTRNTATSCGAVTPEGGPIDGTVVPSAAGSRLAFLPQATLRVLKNIKNRYGSRAWTRYGFVNAVSILSKTGTARMLCGIDTGITMLMAENLRTGFVWETFMKCAEVQRRNEPRRLPSHHLIYEFGRTGIAIAFEKSGWCKRAVQLYGVNSERPCDETAHHNR